MGDGRWAGVVSQGAGGYIAVMGFFCKFSLFWWECVLVRSFSMSLVRGAVLWCGFFL